MKNIYLLLVLTLTNLSVVSQNLSDNLLLHYKFDNNTNDSSSNNYDGVGNISYTIDQNGNNDSAALFNGVNNFVDLPNILKLKPELPITIAISIKFDLLSINKTVAFTTDNTSGINTGVFMSINSSNNSIAVGYGDGGSSGSTTRRTKFGDTTILKNHWYQFIYVLKGYDDIDIYIYDYLNNTSCQITDGGFSGNGKDLIGYGNTAGTIGRNSVITDGYFAGAISDFKFWDRALTSTEINLLCDSNTLNTGQIEMYTNKNIYYDSNLNLFIIPEISTHKLLNVEVYDISGKKQITISKKEINSTIHLSKGFYIIKSNFENTPSTVQKIIVY